MPSKNPPRRVFSCAPPLAGLAPIVSVDTVVLVLGSFPSARSLATGRYYAHPQNHFWTILQAIWPSHPLPPDAAPASARADWLHERGLGVWDVYGACVREGSLDAAIRAPVLNDFALLDVPHLAAVAHNGAESFKHAARVKCAFHAAGHAVLPSYKLPSSSAAHASWPVARKRDAWRDVFAMHGLVS